MLESELEIEKLRARVGKLQARCDELEGERDDWERRANRVPLHRGHRIALRGDPDGGDVWIYCDTGQPVRDNPDRACGVCCRENTPEGHDPCLGTIPGAMNACCGHGRPDAAYVQPWPRDKASRTSPITFSVLRAANIARIPLFKNAKGEPAHSEPDGSDWSDAEWLQAVLGELGEFANLRKKVRRGDLTMADALPALADELADVITYLDILAMRLGVDLGTVVADKFNRVSERVGCDVRIVGDEVRT